MNQKITPFLWFNNNAEEAVHFYIAIFKNSKILKTSRYGDTGPGAKGTVMTILFQLDGQEFCALNGGPQFTFTPAISFVVNCDTQAELDVFWEKLCAGGKPIECGWLQDKFGISWQIVPTIVQDLITGDAERSNRVMKELVKMEKLDIATLERVAKG